MQLPCAGGALAGPPPFGTHMQASSCVMQLPYAGGVRGALPPEPPAGALPLDPKMMQKQSESLALMALGRYKQQATISI
jgi:hypothetical protein